VEIESFCLIVEVTLSTLQVAFTITWSKNSARTTYSLTQKILSSGMTFEEA